MGMNWTMTLLALTMFGTHSPHTLAADGFMKTNLVNQTQASGCHELIMPAECQTYLAALATQPEGSAERRRLVAEHQALIREREAACGGPYAASAVQHPHRPSARQF